MKTEFFSFPPPTPGIRLGALAVDLETGVAVFVNTERTPAANQRLAEERLAGVLTGALTPGEWCLTASSRVRGSQG